MGAEDFLYKLDPTKIRVISGDIPLGFWGLHGCTLSQSPALFDLGSNENSNSSIILDGEIAALGVENIADANPTGNLIGVGVGALAGLRFFGPIGAIGGAVAGQFLLGNRHEITLSVTLKDGRHFVAIMEKSVYQRFKLIGVRSGVSDLGAWPD